MSDAPSAVMDGKRSWAWRGGRVLLFAIHGSRIIWRRAARVSVRNKKSVSRHLWRHLQAAQAEFCPPVSLAESPLKLSLSLDGAIEAQSKEILFSTFSLTLNV